MTIQDRNRVTTSSYSYAERNEVLTVYERNYSTPIVAQFVSFALPGEDRTIDINEIEVYGIEKTSSPSNESFKVDPKWSHFVADSSKGALQCEATITIEVQVTTCDNLVTLCKARAELLGYHGFNIAPGIITHCDLVYCEAEYTYGDFFLAYHVYIREQGSFASIDIGLRKTFSLQKVSHTEAIFWGSHVIINSDFLVGGDNVHGETVAFASSKLEETVLRFMNKSYAYDSNKRDSFRILPSPSKLDSTGNGCIKWHDELVIKLNNDEEYPMYGCKLANLDPSGVIFFKNSFSVFSITPPFPLRKEGCVHAGEQFRLFLVSSEAVHERVNGALNENVDSIYAPLLNEYGQGGLCRLPGDSAGVAGKDYVLLDVDEVACKQRCSTFESCVAYEQYGRCEIWLTMPVTVGSSLSNCQIQQGTVQYDLIVNSRGSCRMSLNNEGLEGSDFVSKGQSTLGYCRTECTSNPECMAIDFTNDVCKIYFKMPNSVGENDTTDSRCEFKHLISARSNRRRSQDATSATISNHLMSRRDFSVGDWQMSVLFSLQTFI